MAGMRLEYCRFVVDDEPYCIWDWDLGKRNRDFLAGVDSGYFTYLAYAHHQFLEGEHQQSAALAIRSAYTQGLETLFSFLSAAIQAPHCPTGWLVKYRNNQLNSLLGKIQNGSPIYSSLGFKSINWQTISEVVHANLVLDDKEKETKIKKQFAKLWSNFAHDFLDETSGHEYNSIKHGLRTKPGGFSFGIGLEQEPGVPAPAESMRLLGKSEFGTRFLIAENICQSKIDKLHFQLIRQRLNWNPEDMLYGLQLIAMSLNNIVSYLKIANGIEAHEVNFEWVRDEDLYREPWKRGGALGISRMSGPETPIQEDEIRKFSKDEILRAYTSVATRDESEQQPEI